MELALIVAVVAILGVGVTFGILLRRLSVDPQSLPATASWIDELSVEKYRPMLRLLSDEDVRFLSTQPGNNSRSISQFRAQRCEIFRGYLRWLQADFSRVCSALKILMVQSQQDRPDLAILLVRQKLMFASGLMAIHFHLLLYRCGISGVSVEGLISCFDSLRLELRQLVPASSEFRA